MGLPIGKFLKDKPSLQFLTIGIIVGLVGAGILFRDVISARAYDRLWISNYDTRLIYWIINWGYHILFEEFSPRNFWDANAFYPNANSLAYSDSLLGLQIFFAPLRLLGLAPLPALYLSLALTCMAGVIGTTVALGKTGLFSLIESALIAYVAHFGLSMTSFFYHYQLFGFEYAPPFLLFLFLYLRDSKLSYLITLCFYFSLGVLTSTYLAPILIALTVMLAPVFIMVKFRRYGARWFYQQAFLGHILVAALFAAGLYIIQLRPYTLLSEGQNIADTEQYQLLSANAIALFTPISSFSRWYPPQWSEPGSWEFGYFPGFILLAAIGVVLGWLVIDGIRTVWLGVKNKTRKSLADELSERSSIQPSSVISQGFLLYMTLSFFSSYLLSLGPQFKWYEQAFSIRMPFYWMSFFIPGLSQVRAPGRIGMLIGLPLAVFLVFIIQKLNLKATSRNFITAGFLVLLAIESLPQYSTYPFEIDSQGVYRQVRQYNPSRKPLLELPLASIEPDQDVYQRIVNQLAGSTLHWSPLVAGYGARFSPELEEFIFQDWVLQNHQEDLAPIIRMAKKLDISLFLIHLDQYPPPVAMLWEKFINNKRACVLWRSESAVLFDLDGSICK